MPGEIGCRSERPPPASRHRQFSVYLCDIIKALMEKKPKQPSPYGKGGAPWVVEEVENHDPMPTGIWQRSSYPSGTLRATCPSDRHFPLLGGPLDGQPTILYWCMV